MTVCSLCKLHTFENFVQFEGGGEGVKVFFFAGVRGKIEFKKVFGALFLPPLYVFLYKNHIYILIIYLLNLLIIY